MNSFRIASFLFCIFASNAVLAYGPAGHEAVGALADKFIAGTHAEQQVKTLLQAAGDNLTLQTAAVWADCAKSVTKSSNGQFHYTVNKEYTECQPFETQEGQARMIDFVKRNWTNCHPEAGEDKCHKQYHYADLAIQRDAYAKNLVGTSDHDIVSAVNAAIAVLQGNPAPAPFDIKDKTEALLLLAHYVGDIHQPLHVAAIYLDGNGKIVDPDQGTYDPATDTRGGNQLLHGTKPLHSMWDSIPAALNATHLGSARLKAVRNVEVTPGPLSTWPTAWATDTLQSAQTAYKGITFAAKQGETWEITKLPKAYTKTRENIQKKELTKAGARLGQVLEAIWP